MKLKDITNGLDDMGDVCCICPDNNPFTDMERI